MAQPTWWKDSALDAARPNLPIHGVSSKRGGRPEMYGQYNDFPQGEGKSPLSHRLYASYGGAGADARYNFAVHDPRFDTRTYAEQLEMKRHKDNYEAAQLFKWKSSQVPFEEKKERGASKPRNLSKMKMKKKNKNKNKLGKENLVNRTRLHLHAPKSGAHGMAPSYIALGSPERVRCVSPPRKVAIDPYERILPNPGVMTAHERHVRGINRGMPVGSNEYAQYNKRPAWNAGPALPGPVTKSNPGPPAWPPGTAWHTAHEKKKRGETKSVPNFVYNTNGVRISVKHAHRPGKLLKKSATTQHKEEEERKANQKKGSRHASTEAEDVGDKLLDKTAMKKRGFYAKPASSDWTIRGASAPAGFLTLPKGSTYQQMIKPGSAAALKQLKKTIKDMAEEDMRREERALKKLQEERILANAAKAVPDFVDILDKAEKKHEESTTVVAPIDKKAGFTDQDVSQHQFKGPEIALGATGLQLRAFKNSAGFWLQESRTRMEAEIAKIEAEIAELEGSL